MAQNKKKNVIAFTGAGISAESGVPTYEDMGSDVRDKLSRQYCIQHRREFFALLKSMKQACDAARPNAAHLALAEHNIPVITMNIDGLHHRAGSIDAIELHGNLRQVYCSSCSQFYPFDQVHTSIHCPKCNAPLEPDVVLYSDEIPRLLEAADLVSGKGILLVIGTSYQTSTASYVTDYARMAGREIITCNENAAINVPKILKTIMY